MKVRLARTRRGRVLLSAALTTTLAAIWAPAVIAHHYADGPGGARINPARVDQGWRFLTEAVRESRGAVLGDDGGALAHAQRIWMRPSGRAERVRLVYFDGPFTVPVPPGGHPPPAGRTVARPGGRFGWAVYGRVRGGPQQMIGLLDYRDGGVRWDIRPRLKSGGR